MRYGVFENVDALYQTLSLSLPEPKTELVFRDSFQLLIAVVLSAQATDKAVNRATPPLFKVAPTPEKMVALGEVGIRRHIRSLGLYNAKARHIFESCRRIIAEHDSKVPDTREALEKLPGVGRKTAGVVLNVAFNRSTIPVDTHVFRLANRTGLAHARNALETEKQLLEITPAWVVKKAHHLLILHGRYICKAQKPLCPKCCIVAYCEYPEKTGA